MIDDTNAPSNANRRDFLKRLQMMAAASTAGPFVLNLAAAADAQAQTASSDGYRALICVYLGGGNDHNNTLIPVDPISYANYARHRCNVKAAAGAIGYLDRNRLNGALLDPAVQADTSGVYGVLTDSNAFTAGATAGFEKTLNALNEQGVDKRLESMKRAYAFSPDLAGDLTPLFNDGKLAVLLNVGPLTQPLGPVNWTPPIKGDLVASNGAVPASVPLKPASLFSHSHQTNFWQTMRIEGQQDGWGGRLIQARKEAVSQEWLKLMRSTNVNGSTQPFLLGNDVVAFRLSMGRVAAVTNDYLRNYSITWVGDAAFSQFLDVNVNTTYSPSKLFESSYQSVVARANGAAQRLRDPLARAEGLIAEPAIDNSTDPDEAFAKVLRRVAAAASVAKEQGLKRQVFFVALTGFDHHDFLTNNHPPLLRRLGRGLKRLDDALKKLTLSDQVTTFTASDFGRTLSSNGNGTDHGWGSHHFILGGAVKGGQYYGIPPVVTTEGVDDIGAGRLRPTTSVDQLAYTLSSWMGVNSDSDIADICPYIENFPVDQRNIGFMKS